ncbi:MAG: IclR family transcriptional regulator [Planctomycetes bacterium]|nr:IclR family transcriptional regulator [Planctomycetota bacterium]
MRFNTSLQKGLTILEIIATQKKGVKLSEIAKQMDLPSSNTSLFLNTLLHGGYIIKNHENGQYCVTGKLRELAQLANVDIYEQIKIAALSEMKELSKIYNENVLLSILSRHHLSVIQEISSTQPIRIINRPEDLFIPHVTAAGKSILAFQTEKKLNNYLRQCEFPKLTKSSVTSQRKLLKELETVKDQGWAINAGEYNTQVYGVAAPVYFGKEVVASLVVQYPSFRHNQEKLKGYAQKVMAAAKVISKEISLQMA